MKIRSTHIAYGFLLACLLAIAPSLRAEENLKAEALLVWGTDDAQSPDPKFIAVDESLSKKLLKSPYRWKHFFVVSRQPLNIPAGGSRKGVVLSKDCSLDVTYLGEDRMEVKLIGKGKLVSTHKESLAGQCVFIIGGASENDTAWFVVIRRNATIVASSQSK